MMVNQFWKTSVCITEITTDENILKSTLSIWNTVSEDCGTYTCTGVVSTCDPVSGSAPLDVIGSVPIWFWPLLRGQPGLDGRPGEKGEKGQPGVQGDTGTPGEVGTEPRETGDRGPTGSTGPRGMDGEDGGVGEAGDQGDEGEKGRDSVIGGAVYTAWGLTECPQTTLTLMEGGLMAVSPKTHTASGANYLCLPNNPSFSNYAGPNVTGSTISGVVYQTTGEPLQANSGRAVPCTVCFTSRPVQLMIPGRATCPGTRWRTEYTGYLMSSRDTPGSPLSTDNLEQFRFRTEYVCVGGEGVGLALTDNGGSDAELYHVHLDCEARSSLDCSRRGYTSGQQLTCVVCSLADD